MTYIIHGATGAQGSPVFSTLQTAGHSATAAVRNTTEATGKSVGIDLSSVDSLTTAYRSVDGVFVHLPIASPEEQSHYARNIAAALRESRPSRVVYSTSGAAPVPESGHISANETITEFLRSSGLSYAIVEPRLFLENLLLPPVMSGVMTEGVLRYPLRDNFAVSWSSHLDVAQVVVRLLTERTINGKVGVGALPGLVGADLAHEFSSHFGTEIRYESMTPEEFGVLLLPLFGEVGSRPVVAAYEHRRHEAADVILPEHSAQQLLGLTPRSASSWLKDLEI